MSAVPKLSESVPLAPSRSDGGAAWISFVAREPTQGTMATHEDLDAWASAMARSADRQAFAALFKHFAPRLKTYLVRLGTAEGVAEDLVQEAMVAVWRKAAQFDPGRASASTWIFTIARNLRVDHFRRLGNQPTRGGDDDDEAIEQADTAPTPDEELLTRQRESGVRAALRQLTPDQARVLQLSFFEDKPHARIAQELAIPLGTVKSRVRLAVQRLRQLLPDLEP